MAREIDLTQETIITADSVIIDIRVTPGQPRPNRIPVINEINPLQQEVILLSEERYKEFMDRH